MTSVVVVDDQGLVRAGLVSILRTQSDIDVVGEACDGEEAVALVLRLDPDVVLMDVRMPSVDGIEATRRLAGRRSAIVMLTTFDLDEYVYAALKAGACGFLLKDAPPESLVAAVRSAGRGEALLAPEITRRLVEQYVRLPAPGAATPEVLEPLTPRERGCWPRWGAATATARSPAGCSCPRRRSRPTWRARWPSCGCATGRRPSCWPTSRA